MGFRQERHHDAELEQDADRKELGDQPDPGGKPVDIVQQADGVRQMIETRIPTRNPRSRAEREGEQDQREQEIPDSKDGVARGHAEGVPGLPRDPRRI